MSDETPTPDGVADTTQSAVEGTSQNHGFDGEFDPERARSTINHLREREKELAQYERELNALRSDPDRAAEFVRDSHGWEFDTGTDDADVDEFVDPHAADIAALKAWKEQQDAERMVGAISSHIDTLTAEADLDPREKQWLLQNAALGDASEQRTEQLVKDYLELQAERRDAAVEGYRKSKKASPKPPTGTPGEPAFDPKDPDSRMARMAAIVEATDG